MLRLSCPAQRPGITSFAIRQHSTGCLSNEIPRLNEGGMVTAEPKSGHSLTLIPKGVWVLGFVSMLMDISSEMIHALLPVYLVTVLGTSMVTVGIIEGVAEATA